jgi:DmsE family decaheme c-type cytochrome
MILMAACFLFPSNVCPQDQADCLDCHEDIEATLIDTPHEIGTVSKSEESMIATCFDCHSGWQRHLDNPTAENIQRGPELSQAAQGEVCGGCHVSPHQAAMVTDDPHARANLTCSSCHKVHGNRNKYLAKEDLDNFCTSCHEAVVMEFQQRSAHPLESGNVRCTDCHDLSYIGAAEFKVGFKWRCQNCHDEKSGPFPYEHQVVYGHLVEGGTCVECHQPHGSVNDQLLKQPGKTLCLQCHGIPPGHQAVHTGLGARLDCVQCHSEIHGSFSNRLLLDPDLGDKMVPNCYQAGCHSIGNQGG